MRVSLLAAAGIFTTAVAGSTIERRQTVSNPKTPPVSVKGNAFFTSSGRFYIRGVDYQPGGSSQLADPIADAAGCSRDVAEFQKLGINTIRVYSVDNSKNHDACMKTLADAGIYLALDVNTPYYSLNRADNASCARSYNDVYLQSVFATVDAFAKYDNTLLFYSGNEVINAVNTSFAAPYIKAVTRDIKAYISARKYRQIPTGYSAADVQENRFQTAEYLNCGMDSVRSDFFAFNDYSWCDPSSYSKSGWDQKVALFSNYSLPLFLSEFGCNTNTRDFGEIAALYGSKMTPVYSGGLVYEYSNEASNYGLVTISGGSVSELTDFTTLKDAYAKTKNPTSDGGYKSSGVASNCPGQDQYWVINDSTGNYLPIMPAGAQKYFSSGAGKGPGNSGTTGSQNAGTASTGYSTADGTSSSSSSSTPKKSAAGALRAPEVTMVPFVISAVLLFSSVLGGARLFF